MSLPAGSEEEAAASAAYAFDAAASSLEPDTRETRFGSQAGWERRYEDEAEFSWYCGWADLEPFWRELVPDLQARVLLPGIGNDAAMVGLFDAGWTNLCAFDYAPAGVARAAELFGDSRSVELLVADARALPFEAAAFDAALDKGALDAVYLSGGRSAEKRQRQLQLAVHELERTIQTDGVVLSVSAAAAEHVSRAFERSGAWRQLRDGGFYMTEDGYASNNVDATLLAWRRVDGSTSSNSNTITNEPPAGGQQG